MEDKFAEGNHTQRELELRRIDGFLSIICSDSRIRMTESIGAVDRQRFRGKPVSQRRRPRCHEELRLGIDD